ncbi:MAG: glycosyltransferase [Kiritimatiellae bacterium]|nr:glycosyltransferase [Kiritimatiellia bacterium]
MTVHGQEPLFVSFIIPHRPDESVERTAAALRAACEKSGVRFELLSAWGNNPTVQRNACIGRARSGVLYFLDNDSVVREDTLRRLAERLEARPDVDIVGGPSLTPATDTFLPRSFGAVLASRFGVGPIAARYSRRGVFRETNDTELILCNLVVKRNVFADVGLFDEHLYPNEENEFIFRARAAGKKAFYDPSLAVYRPQRPNLRAFARQIFNYGRGRGEQTRRVPASFNAFLAVPLLFLAYLVAGPLAALAVWMRVPPGLGRGIALLVLASPLALYGALSLVCSALACVRQRGFFVHLPLLFLLNHLCYGAGLLYGLFRRDFKADRQAFSGGLDASGAGT